MDFALKIAWGLLAATHVMPALVFFRPEMTARLYDIAPTGDIGLLLVHRGALFAAVCAAAVFALFDTEARRLASLVLAISIVGFLIVYLRAGAPTGALRTIAIVDLIALAPLAFVLWAAWLRAI